MKICIDLTSIYDKLSGIERFCLNITKHMITNDKDNNYVLIFKKEIHKEFLFIKNMANVKYKIINLENKLILSQLILPIVLYLNKCDLYLFLSFPSPLLFFNKNIINTVHDMTPWLYPETMSKKGLIYFKILIKNAVKCSKLLLTVSNSSKSDIRKIFYNNIKVIYNGVDKKFLRITDKNIKEDFIKKKYKLPDKYIFSLGTVEPRKNLNLLIKAFIQLKKENKLKNYKLVLSGRLGWKYDSLLENVKRNNLQDEVIFTGFIDDDDLPYVYSYAKCFVFPSLYEGFGIPPLEAMAVGTPVICSDSSSLPEVVGDSGILFENNNFEDLKTKIEYFMELDEKKVKVMIIQQRRRVLCFDWDKESKKVLEIVNNFSN